MWEKGREIFEMERSYLLFDDYSHCDCVCMNEMRKLLCDGGGREEKQFKFHKNVKE